MSDIKWTPVIIVGIITLIIGGFVGGMLFPKEIEKDCPESNATDCPEVNQTDCPTDQTDRQECKTCEELEQEAIITGGYLIDGLFLEDSIDFLKYKKLGLFNGDVEFGGKDYDAKEKFTFTDLRLKANGNDFEGNAYLTILEEGIFYEFVFEDSLDTIEIDDQETLVFDLLGEEVEVSKWKNDEVTFTAGKKYSLEELESIEVDGKTILLVAVSENSILVNIDDTNYVIDKDKTKTVGNLGIRVLEIFEGSQITKGFVTLRIGENVEVTISDTDLYEKDSIWEWAIDDNSIGLILTEDFEKLEEDFNALAPEEKICLPNDYVCVYYNGLAEEETEEYTFKVDGEFVRIKGNFECGTSDYTKIYVKDGSIYEDDDDTEDALCSEIRLGNTDSFLTIIDEKIVIDDFRVNYGLSISETMDINEWKPLNDKDEDYLTNYGILVIDPKDSVNDEFNIFVPEEQLEGSIIVKKGGFEETEAVCDVDNLELCLDETTCTDAKGYWYGDVCNVEEASSE